MAFVTKNGFDVEKGSSLVVFENLMPSLKHIAGKGVTENFITKDDVTKMDTIDITRILPKKINYRKLGATTNGNYLNEKNWHGGSQPQSTHYTVDLSYLFDEDSIIPYSMTTETPVQFEKIINKNITDCLAQTMNAFTWANQYKAFFDDNTAVTRNVFVYDANTTPARAFVKANAALQSDKSIGAFTIPVEERQAFISPDFNADLKSQYATNASEAAAQINATGYINPFTKQEGKRIDARTGVCGLYDGVVMTQMNDIEKENVYEVLGVSDNSTVCGLLDKIAGFIVYGGATLRGFATQGVQANADPYQANSIVLKPYSKFGCATLSGKSMKVIASDTLTDENLATIKAAISIADNVSSHYTNNDKAYETGVAD